MILWPQPDGTVLATAQPAHALISGQLMRALADLPAPLEPAVTAAAMHDCPWMEWETAPEYDAATGLPRAFNDMPGSEHVTMWEKGVRLAICNWGLLVGLLILRHGSHIYRLSIMGNRITPSPESLSAMEGYIARETTWGAELMAKLGMDEAQVAPISARLAMVDGVALALCWGHNSFNCAGTTLRRSAPFAATLDAWPLAARAMTVSTEAMRLPGPFKSAEAMRAGLAIAPRETLIFNLSAASTLA